MKPAPNPSPVFLRRYSWRAVLYRALKYLYSLEIRGGWRFHMWGKALMSDRYIKLPYLDNGKIWLNPHHAMGRDIVAGILYEEAVISVIQSFIEKGYSYIDIGANIGLHTVSAGLSRKNDTQRFYAFEPEAKAFTVLNKNCKENHLRFFHLEQAAVGNKEDTTELYVSTTRNQGHHSLFPQEENTDTQICEVIRLDNYDGISTSLAKQPFLVKIDAEGSETEALMGAINFLSRLKTLAIICEISPEELERAGHVAADILNTLAEIGCESYYLFKDDGIHEVSINQVRDTEHAINVLAHKGKASRDILQGLAK